MSISPQEISFQTTEVIRQIEIDFYTKNGARAGVYWDELHLVKTADSCTVFQTDVMALKVAAEHVIITGREAYHNMYR